MLQGSTADPNVESLPQEPELLALDLTVPDFTAIVNHSHLLHKVVDLEKLNDFALQVKVWVVFLLLSLIVFEILWCTFGWNVAESVQILRRQHRLLLEIIACPLPERFDRLVLSPISHEFPPKEGPRLELFLGRHREVLWVEDSPAAVEAHVCDQLLVSFVRVDVGTMDADDLAASLADGKVVELLCEADQCYVLNHSVIVEFAALVSNFQAHDVVCGLFGLMWVGGFEDDGVEVGLLFADFELIECLVVILLLFGVLHVFLLLRFHLIY
jgi:hypothetical protein